MENTSTIINIEFYPNTLPKQRISRVNQTTSKKSSLHLTKKSSRNAASTPNLIRKRSSATRKVIKEKAIRSSTSLDLDTLLRQMEVNRSSCSIKPTISSKAPECDKLRKQTYMNMPVENVISEEEYDPTRPQVKYIEQTSIHQMEMVHGPVRIPTACDIVTKKCQTDSCNPEVSVFECMYAKNYDLIEDEYDPKSPQVKYFDQLTSDQMDIIRSYSSLPK